MRLEDILQARQEYGKRKMEKMRLCSIKRELVELKNDPKVKRYLEICHIENVNIPSEEEIMRASFSMLERNKYNSSGNIYFYLGAFIRNRVFDQEDCRIRDVERADYLKYLNLDDEYDCVCTSPRMMEEFEKRNVVLKSENAVDIMQKYYQLQSILYAQYLKSDLINKEKILEKVKEYL